MTEHTEIFPVTFLSDELKGKEIINKVTTIANLENFFADEKSRSEITQDKLVYEVQAHLPVKEGLLAI